MTTGGSIFPSVACCRRARYQAKKAVGACIGFVRGRFSASRCRSKRLAMPYANLRGQIKKLPWSHPQPFNPPLCNPPPSGYYGGSETSYVHGEQYARVETAFISVHYSSSARYRGRLCAADSEDESTAVKE